MSEESDPHTANTAEETRLVARQYVFDNAKRYAEIRYQLLSEMFDEATTRHLASTGAGGGWRCLEAGAGAGSVARWLSKRVGPAGRVIATDLDTTLLQRLRLINVQVRRHDLVRDHLDQREFDLVHTRLVLMHLPQREQALSKLCDAVKPGGWIVLEEFDSLSQPADSSLECPETPLKTARAFRQHVASQGVDLGYGRTLTGSLVRRRFENIRSEGRLAIWQGGSAGSRFMRSTYEELREQILRTGVVTEEEYERDLTRLDDPSFLVVSPVMWSVCGRRPAGS